jgi:hypothetical protein
MDTRECKKCKTIQPIEEFPSNGNKHGGKRWQCKKCMQKINQKWRENKKTPQPTIPTTPTPTPILTETTPTPTETTLTTPTLIFKNNTILNWTTTTPPNAQIQ